MIDIITIYNDTDLYKQMKESASSCGVDINFIGIDNTKQKYSSAAMAYNEAVSLLCRGEVIVFCHQDILFPKGEVDLIYELCIKNKNVCFGAAGVKNEGSKKHTISSITDGNGKYDTIRSGEICEVFSLDECLICGYRDIFSRLRFDEKVCDGFHLYAVDFSIACHEQGIKVMVYGSGIAHLSGGKIDKKFRNTEKRLIKKYKNKYELITYTCGWSYTKFPRRFLYKFTRYIARIVRFINNKVFCRFGILPKRGE